jgi:phosphopantetheinyl transferase (holo-ACP synthase)
VAKKNLRTKEAQEVREPDYEWIAKVVAEKPAALKALAKLKLRVVKLTDVTVNRESLTRAIASSGKIPGNEIPAFVEQILKDVIIND